MLSLRKTLTGALAAVTLAGGVLAAAAPAEAQWRGRGGYHRGGGWVGPGIAAGVIGGLALGAMAAPRPAYGYGGGYGYAPAYAEPSYSCFHQRRPAYDPWGNFVGYRVVRVCQ